MSAFFQFSFVALALMASAPVFAKPKWKVLSTGEQQFVLQNLEDKKLRHSIMPTLPGSPRYIGKTKTKKTGIVLLIYLSGSAGTSALVDIYRAVVFNTNSKKFYGDFPFKIQSPNPRQSWPDTIFTFYKDFFTVEDSSTNLKKTIRY